MQEADYKWFLDHFSDLYQEYGHTFLAIKNKTIIGVYDTYADGVKNAMQKEPLGTFIVQECGPDESAYTVYISSLNIGV